ncbi:MAG TPA: ADP-ribosylglycohydrolase family protein [Anaerolineae bacterium]|nr:ADP-ribosylglycohydrolase family protein [Anaerolineae bacterium]
MATIPNDYEERVYAGVLGKIIGVYVGRPFEGWPHARIMRELGEIKYYVHERLGKPLIVADDDISGTFTFLRAMPDYGTPPDLTPAQIGQTWLNYLIEPKTVLWWGGMGTSTEHTAYLRLKAGIMPPKSGSIELNGRVVAEQIGAQIFIDGWGMISPGDPEQAASLARRAACVSHDGEAIYAAQVLAAMVAQAFVESDIDALLDVGTTLIPPSSLIYRLIGDLRDWHGKCGDWRETFRHIVANYGYHRYGGGCHVVPNHALIILALLYCEDSFQRALTIVNTAGWDTDCNSGNVGCLMGIKGGLAGLDAGPDFRGPVADRMYLPTADGGRAVTDALHEAYEIAQIGRALAREPAPLPKQGSRFHFDLPGSVQGFVAEDSPECRGTASIENVPGHSQTGRRSLAIRYRGLADGRAARIIRETYPAIAADTTHGYRLVASPTLYPGQDLSARLEADEENRQAVEACLLIKAFGENDQLLVLRGPKIALQPGTAHTMEWVVDAPVGCPTGWVGVELMSLHAATRPSDTRAEGMAYLDWLTWSVPPKVKFDRPSHKGTRWLDAWVQAVTTVRAGREHTYDIVQNEGTGLLIQGTREWQDYVFRATLTPHLARSFGIAARVQGLRRYYALRLALGGKAQLVRKLDGTHVLAEAPYDWELYASYQFELQVQGSKLTGRVDGQTLFQVEDDSPLTGGAIALLVEEGRVGCDLVEVRPVS